ncbi:TonB-dependent receptor [Pseudomaricurvus sp. HS19]|uniref:TonB-dependent receptor n=1 Tax=Pseudomaricurvus sp. HS19 TaxID=2692626 RepID=UPI0013686F31|nr:TonB-dependent receptor [Pseudomaricurvus sp. HS19]MYM61820.1 TonB-dependent receptor [Pseudomaricurvus sp. HS19]
MEKQLNKSLLASCIALLCAGVSSPETVRAAATLEEVVVTATRREEGLQSIPASIAAVTGDGLAQQGITDFTGVADKISGLTLDFPSTAINAAIYMRGVGTTGPSAVQSVSTMVDGVYQIRQGLAFTELMDIERVEVLRGPQGTLFGKNSTSGAIRIFTADPNPDEFSGKVQGVAGNLDAQELRGIVNIPLIEGKLGARISGYTAERDGYTENVYLNEDTRNVDREGWRAKLLWNVTDDLQLKLTADNHKQSSRLDNGITEYSTTALNNAAALGVTLPQTSLGKAQEDQSSFTKEEVERYIFNVKWSFANHTLSTISAWEENNAILGQDRDETIAPGQVVAVHPVFGPIVAPYTNNETPQEIMTHEVQWASDFEGPFSYLIGIYYQDESTESITSIPPLFDGTTPIEVKSKALFGNVSYDFNDQWSASLGLRKDKDERTGSNSVVGQNHVEEFDEVTYSAKLTYQMDTDIMLYVSHDKGFKSGGVQRDFAGCGRGGNCITPDLALWDPETAYNYEFGFKTEWFGNRLRVNGALFYTKFEDFQVLQNVPSEVSVLVTNAAEAETKGLELEFTGVVTDHLTIDGSASYVLAEYSDYEGAPCAYSTQPGCVGGLQDLSGETLDHAPEFSLNLGGEYRRGIGSGDMEWFGRIDMTYRSDQNLYVLLPEETEEDAYALFNLRFGLEVANSWGVTLWGKNILDEEYRSAADTAGSAGLSEVPGLERTYGVTLDWYF